MESGTPMKMKWEHVSKEMANQQYTFSSEQCKLKITNFKECHLKLQNNLKQFGADDPNDTLEEGLAETFGSQPGVHPVCSMDSMNTKEQIIINDIKKPKGIARGSSWDSAEDASASDSEKLKRKLLKDDPKVKSKKARTKARPSTADISTLMLKPSEDAARRHNEKMALQREFINVLRESLKKN